MAELQGLEFKITAETKSATDGLNNLAASMERLKAASKGRLGLTSTQTQNLVTLSETLEKIKPDNSEGLVRLASALEVLGKTKFTKRLTERLTELSTAATNIPRQAITNVQDLASALQGMNGIKIPSLGKAAGSAGGSGGKKAGTGLPGAVDTSGVKMDVDVSDASRQLEGVSGVFDHTAIRGNVLADVIGRVGHALGSTLYKGAQLAAYGMGRVKAPLTQLPMQLGQKFATQVKQATSSLGGLFSSLKRIAMYRLLRTAIKLFTEGLSQGLQNLYQWSNLAGTTFAGNMDRIATASNYVKNSFAAMVSPLLESLSPALDYIADKVVAVFNLINQLFSRLAGKTTYTAAKKVSTAWQDAASSAGNGAAGAAKKAADELKRTILSFDELHVLNDKNTSSSGGGSGGGSGSGTGADIASMFEERAIDGAVSNFADQLKEAFENGDWETLGRTLGAKFNEIVDNFDWSGWGQKVGYGINGAIQTAYFFLDEADFENLGKKIGSFINNALAQIDMEYAGRLLVKQLTSIADLLIGVIEGTSFEMVTSKLSDALIGIYSEVRDWFNSYDWSEIGTMMYNKLKDAVKGIKFAEIADAFYGAFGAALHAAIDFLWGVISSIATDIGDYFKNHIAGDSLQETGENILKAIADGLTGINDFVNEHIIEPFMSNLLGAERWEKVKEAGEEIMNGIRDGITSVFSDPVKWCYDNILVPFVDGIKGAFGIHSPASEASLLEAAGNIGWGILKGIASPFLNIVGWVAEHILAPIRDAIGDDDIPTLDVNVPDTLTVSITAVKDETWDTVIGEYKAVKSTTAWKVIAGQVHHTFVSVRTAFNNLKSNTAWKVIAGKKHNTFDAAKRTFDGFKSGSITKTVKGVVARGFYTARNIFNSLKSNSVTKTFVGKITGAFHSAKNAFNGLKNHKITLTATGTISSTVRTIKSIWNGLKSKTITVTAKMRAVWSGISSRIRSLLGLHTGGIYKNGGWKPIQSYASGGYPFGGQIFRARENGNPELVGTLNGSTAVMNNDQIVSSVSSGVSRAIAGIHFQLKGLPSSALGATPDAFMAGYNQLAQDDLEERRELINAMDRQNELLRRQNDLLQDIASKETVTEVTASSFARAAARKNRRDGRTTIPVGV